MLEDVKAGKRHHRWEAMMLHEDEDEDEHTVLMLAMNSVGSMK